MVKYRYQIIEYDYVKMTNKEVEVCKTLHKTNSKLFYYILILCFKLNHIKYEVVRYDWKSVSKTKKKK